MKRTKPSRKPLLPDFDRFTGRTAEAALPVFYRFDLRRAAQRAAAEFSTEHNRPNPAIRPPPSYFQSASQLRGVFHGTGSKHKIDSAGSVPPDNLICAFKPDVRLPFIYLNPQRFPRIHNFIVKGKPFFAAAVVLPRAARPLQCLQRGNGQNGICMYERARPVEMIERMVEPCAFAHQPGQHKFAVCPGGDHRGKIALHLRRATAAPNGKGGEHARTVCKGNGTVHFIIAIICRTFQAESTVLTVSGSSIRS